MTDALSCEHRVIVAGSGGQGVLTFCKLLCMAAVGEGRNVTYLPSYGPEVRSGTARCRVVISSETILSPLVERPDLLVLLNQASYDRFADALRPGGLMCVNSSAVDELLPPGGPGARAVALPATQMAVEMGDMRVANVILLGALVQASGLVGQESCRSALRELMGTRGEELLELNLRALDRGIEAAGRTSSPATHGPARAAS